MADEHLSRHAAKMKVEDLPESLEIYLWSCVADSDVRKLRRSCRRIWALTVPLGDRAACHATIERRHWVLQFEELGGQLWADTVRCRVIAAIGLCADEVALAQTGAGLSRVALTQVRKIRLEGTQEQPGEIEVCVRRIMGRVAWDQLTVRRIAELLAPALCMPLQALLTQCKKDVKRYLDAVIREVKVEPRGPGGHAFASNGLTWEQAEKIDWSTS